MKRPRALLSASRLAAALQAPPSVEAIEPSYHEVRQEAILRAVAKHFSVNPAYPGVLLGKQLLDVGCGTAPLSCFFALAGADVTAIDPNRDNLKAAESYAEAFGTPVNFMNVPAEKLISFHERYDVILALDVLCEAPHAGKLIWVLAKLLAPGGVLVVGHTTRSVRAWFMHIFLSRTLFHRVKEDLRSWQGFHTPAQLAELAHAAGLQEAGTTLLRYSLNGSKWKETSNRRIFTRYLSCFKASA